MNWEPPQNPYLAANGKNNVHNDSYMTDSYTLSGPEGNNLKLTFFNTLPRVFITIAFDRQGRILTLGTGADSKRAAYLLTPDSLKLIDSYELPAGSEIGISGAGYFYVDNNDRMVVPTTNNHIYKLKADNLGKLKLETDIDLSSMPSPCHFASVLPDWKGRLWFITEEGVVGIVNDDNHFKTLSLRHTENGNIINEKIGNSFAIDETGSVFIVSDFALYSIGAGEDNQPEIFWRESYDRGSKQKPSQFTQGSGTTPTLISDDYVAITDNAEPRMNVLIYKRKKEIDGGRLLCKIPVFSDNASATENSLITFHNSIIVENNYGYTKVIDFVGKFSEPGMTRIDFHADGSYEKVWYSDVTVPSLVSKVAMGNNTVYTYTKEPDGWYLTGLDFDTGIKKFQTKAGNDEFRYNNHYSGISITEDGSAYVGCAGGIIRFSK